MFGRFLAPKVIVIGRSLLDFPFQIACGSFFFFFLLTNGVAAATRDFKARPFSISPFFAADHVPRPERHFSAFFFSP